MFKKPFSIKGILEFNPEDVEKFKRKYNNISEPTKEELEVFISKFRMNKEVEAEIKVALTKFNADKNMCLSTRSKLRFISAKLLKLAHCKSSEYDSVDIKIEIHHQPIVRKIMAEIDLNLNTQKPMSRKEQLKKLK